MAYFQEWDGTLKEGSFTRASSSNVIVWGEPNLTTDDLAYGHAVAYNPLGGVKKYSAVGDVFAGIVVRDIYGNEATPNNKITNVAKIGVGDGICVATVTGQTFARGGKAHVVVSGANAGKFTATKAATTLDVGYIVEKIGTNGVIEVTLNNSQVAGA